MPDLNSLFIRSWLPYMFSCMQYSTCMIFPGVTFKLFSIMFDCMFLFQANGNDYDQSLYNLLSWNNISYYKQLTHTWICFRETIHDACFNIASDTQCRTRLSNLLESLDRTMMEPITGIWKLAKRTFHLQFGQEIQRCQSALLPFLRKLK